MRVLVACEFSGTVRDAFAARGHDAWSCDLLQTETPGNQSEHQDREAEPDRFGSILKFPTDSPWRVTLVFDAGLRIEVGALAGVGRIEPAIEAAEWGAEGGHRGGFGEGHVISPCRYVRHKLSYTGCKRNLTPCKTLGVWHCELSGDAGLDNGFPTHKRIRMAQRSRQKLTD